MMVRRFVSVATAAALLVVPSVAEANAGKSCKKAGAVNAARMKCTRVGKKLVWVSQATTPSAITNVGYSTSNGVLSWGNPASWGNPVATYFALETRINGVSQWTRIADLGIEKTWATISGLVQGATYEFRVAAGNSAGLGGFGYSQAFVYGAITATTVVGTAVSTTTTVAQTTTTTTLAGTVSQQQAVKKAASYLRSSSFSRSGLIGQLQYEGFSLADATYGVDAQNADWSQQAVKKGASYLRSSSFSRSGLIGQLQYEGFSLSEATFGTDSQNADWNAQAAKKAASHLRSSSFSRSGLINQLLYEGFTQAQAEYGVNSVGL